jgi:riboflavin synthase
MFTGIVRERGRVVSVEPRGEGISLRVAGSQTAGAAAAGDSVAVSGVCLTVEQTAGDELSFWAGSETLERTKVGRLQPGDEVNLEPALRAGEPFGGHIVQGHVDAVGRVRLTEAEGEGVRMWVDAPPQILRYCVEKGSVAVDGVSLTVAALDDAGFEVALVAYTLAETSLGTLPAGDEVNLEADVLGKYVERLLAPTREA